MKGTIKENRDFCYGYRRGKKVVSHAMVLHYYPNRTGETKLGITVSKGVGKAVKRNRAKRLVRACFQAAKPHIKPGYNIIIVARTVLAHMKQRDAMANLEYCLKKSELMK